MTTPELLQFHADLCQKARELMAKKNFDYAGPSGDTPFANFEATEKLGITTTEQGMLMRMTDKIMRLSTFAQSGQLKVENEGPLDACTDILNYAILLAAYIKSKGVK